MFERFTDRSRKVVVLAQEEARVLEHNYIGTEHLLLGLIHEGEGVAAKTLQSMQISIEDVRSRVEKIIGQGSKSAPSGHIPFTPSAKKVLELSLREALQLGHDYIGTEHILLGLIREGEGVAAQVLESLGADFNRVRQQVLRVLSGYTGREEGADPAPEGRPPFLRAMDEAIAAVTADKDAALDKGELDQAVQARDRERGLREELANRERAWEISIGEMDTRLHEVRRLKEEAIDRQEFEIAGSLREQERKLMKEHAALLRGEDLG